MNRPVPSEVELSRCDLEGDLEDYVEAFEEDRRAVGPRAVSDYLPSETHPDFAAIAAELVRVDLERRLTRGDTPCVDDYRTVAPLLFASPEALSEAAFEEYRLRCRAGEQLTPDEYAKRYGIDPSNWPSAQSVAASEQGLFGVQPLPSEGESFAGFDLVEELGRGAFGVAFLARQTDLAAREVVLKITPRRSVEAQRLAKLHHTNITPIYSTHSSGGLLGICMPYLGRATLASCLGRHTSAAEISTHAARRDDTVEELPKSLHRFAGGQWKEMAGVPEAVALDIVDQLATGLAHAHERGIVHSDIKPANVLLGDDGIPRLLDFNLSTDASRCDLQTVVVGGTLPYLAPEHLESLLSGEPVQPASDVYSLGVLLYQLTTGRLPFSSHASDGDLETLIAERRSFDVWSLRSGSELSQAVKAILGKALAPEPSQRYTAAELAEDIRRHRQNQPLRFAREPLGVERLVKWQRRHRGALRWAAATVVGTAAVVAIAIASARGKQLDQAAAAQALNAFQAFLLDARVHLHSPGSEPELWETGAQSAAKALALFDAPGSARLELLKPEDQRFVAEQSVQLETLLGELSNRAKQPAKRRNPLGITPRENSSDPIAAAAALASRGEHGNVIDVLQDVDSELASDPVRWLLLGNSLAAEGRLVEAAAAYTALVALQPAADAGYYYRGLAHLEGGSYSLAVADFSDAIERSPQTTCYLLNRAVARRRMGGFRAAEQDVSRALGIDDQNTRAWLLRADLRSQLGQAQEAQEDIRRGLALEPTDDVGYSAQAMALLGQSPEQAVTRLEEGLALYPESPSLLKNIVHVLSDRLPLEAQAIPYAERLAALRPNDAGPRLTLAVLTARQGDRVAALRHLPKLDIATMEPLEALQMACVYALTSNIAPDDATMAIQWLQVALLKEPRLCFRAKSDPDLASMDQNPEYRQLLAASAQLATPGGARRTSQTPTAKSLAVSDETAEKE